jgi:peptidoglycan/LPS O-acetylase OafA/YrhL
LDSKQKSNLSNDGFRYLSESNSVLLDGLRAFASQLVVFFHGIVLCQVFKSLTPPHFPYLQSFAVTLFFLISGFIIPYSVNLKKIKVPGYNFRLYFIDRFARIYSVLIPVLVGVWFVDLYTFNQIGEVVNYEENLGILSFLGNLLMLENFPFLRVEAFGTCRPIWTLAIEWWIYMFYGYLYLSVGHKFRNVLQILILTFLGFSTYLNTVNQNSLTISWLLGLLLFDLYNRKVLAKIGNGVKLYFATLIVFLLFYRIYKTNGGYDLVVSFGLLSLLLIVFDLFERVKVKKYFIFLTNKLANCSYSLYLIHYTVFEAGLHFFGHVEKISLFFLLFAIANIISFAMGYFLERKLTIFLKRILVLIK